MEIVLKRVYSSVSPDDGCRVLVDRLWPRGISKESAELHAWAKAAAPSTGLRKRWHADADNFDIYAAEYRAELAVDPASSALNELADLARHRERITLLFGAKDLEQNHAIVLREALLERLSSVSGAKY
ncbi:DUF488 family protein [Leucobacter coleopterorum]|uniref:DUF488 family protein n=1 Tax=Leucobacter coleopterorum TaxID=2714933 RepID=A0ABX6JWR0_9MICO|nr:DUF488 family protein [Leucobacter coleopterorum]QIM18745.1 DUF488 family protein [Leucobacter coleopterorum]